MNFKQLSGAIFGTIVKIGIAAAIIIVVFKLAVSMYDVGFQIFADIPVSAEGNGRTVNVVISDSMDARDVGKLLEEKGLIKNNLVFYVQEQLSEYKGQIKSGSYELNTSMSGEEMIEIMCGAAEESVEE